MSKIVREYINKLFTMRSVWAECFGESAPHGKCFCPFHDNSDSPAAKIYDNKLVCFGSCQRSYFPYDFLHKFRPDLLRVHSSTVLPELVQDLTPQLLCRFGRNMTAEQLLHKFTGL